MYFECFENLESSSFGNFSIFNKSYNIVLTTRLSQRTILLFKSVFRVPCKSLSLSFILPRFATDSRYSVLSRRIRDVRNVRDTIFRTSLIAIILRQVFKLLKFRFSTRDDLETIWIPSLDDVRSRNSIRVLRIGQDSVIFGRKMLDNFRARSMKKKIARPEEKLRAWTRHRIGFDENSFFARSTVFISCDRVEFRGDFDVWFAYTKPCDIFGTLDSRETIPYEQEEISSLTEIPIQQSTRAWV